MNGPIDQGFVPHPDKPCVVLIGGVENAPFIISLAESLRARIDVDWKPLVFLDAESTFPFRTRPSTIIVDGMPDGVIAAVKLLDEQGIPSRLSSHSDSPGCHEGLVTELAEAWLVTLNQDTLNEVALFVCDSKQLLAAAAKVAQRFKISCVELAAESRSAKH